jgi:drug/metabolite transporter (DMT)-like permease
MVHTTEHPLPAPPDTDRRLTRSRAIGQGCTILVGLGGVLLAGRAIGVHAPPCPFRTATGVPCPGCGMTRLADAVVHGRIGDAVAADPAGVAILVALVVVAAVYAVTVLVRKGDPPSWIGGPIVIGGFVVLGAVHWATTAVNGFLPAS